VLRTSRSAGSFEHQQRSSPAQAQARRHDQQGREGHGQAREERVEQAGDGVLPEGKLAFLAERRATGAVVAMVGDGVNDGPALAAADLGLAVGTGTDVALEAADVILVRDDLTAVPEALALARATHRTIRVNLGWAFGYNVAAIPLAVAGLLNPLLAGLAMALSSLLVVTSSLRLRGR
jgi:cation transport ATPase